jgi:hypothetical protein
VLPGGRIRTALLIGDADNSRFESDNIHLRIFRLGTNGGVSEDLFTYRAEYLRNFGELNRIPSPTQGNLKYKGSAVDLGVGFNGKENSHGILSLWGNYFRASGDKKNDDTDKSFHDFSLLGINSSDRTFGEIFGKSNAMTGDTPRGQGADGLVFSENQGLQVFNIGVGYKPVFAPKTLVRIEYFNLSRTVDSHNDAPVGKKYGDEYDLTLGYDHSVNVGFEAGYAMLMPGSALIGDPALYQDKNITKLFARAKVKWGGEAAQ